MKTLTNLMLLIFIIVFSACEDKKSSTQTPSLIEVGYITAKQDKVSISMNLSGRVKAKEVAQIRPQISGIVEKRVFKEGSFVQKGDILYKIDNSTYLANYNQTEALLNSAKASLFSYETKEKRAAELIKIDGVSQQEYDDIKASYLQAKALVKQREAELQSAKIDLQRCEIKAPISGYIGISSVTSGALVLANQSDALASIQDSKFVYVDLTISYSELLNLKNLINFDETVELTLTLDNNFTYPKRGILESKELSVDESSGTVTLRAEFENSDNILLPGMFVKATLHSSNKVGAFLIPQQAVLRDQKANPIITIINSENKPVQKVVNISRAVGDKWLILDGIDVEDKIIIEGLNKITSRSSLQLKDLNDKYKD